MNYHLKMSLMAILLLGALVRGCSRAGKAADGAADLSKASRLNRIDDAAGLGASSRAIDDVAYLDPNIVSARFSMFEINHINNLPKNSFISKAYKSSEGLSPNMRLKTLQMELMPPSVKSNLLRDNGGHLYSVMMGKKINAEEAAALQTLFEVPVKATDEALDGFHYISSKLPKNLDEYDRIEEIRYAQAINRQISNNKKIQEIYQPRLSGTYGEKTMDDFSELWTKKGNRKRQTVIVDEPIAPEQAKTLSFHKIKAVFHARHLFDSHGDDKEIDAKIIFLINNDVEQFASVNSLQNIDATRIRKNILQLKGTPGVLVVNEISELVELVKNKKITAKSLNIIIGRDATGEMYKLSASKEEVPFYSINPIPGSTKDIVYSQIAPPNWDLILKVFGKNRLLKAKDKIELAEKIASEFVENIKKENLFIENAVINFDMTPFNYGFINITYIYKEELTSQTN
ncbi:MAG: hypothetical protein ACK4WD_13430 [Flavobacteriales bacterium]|jgi:hypothetical protein